MGTASVWGTMKKVEANPRTTGKPATTRREGKKYSFSGREEKKCLRNHSDL